MELLTAAQMRAIEAAAIASGTVTGLELMERAGAGVVSAILEEWPELATGERRAVVLCGPGNNGGDGFVVARLLRERGWAVEVFLYGEAARLPADARVNYERWREVGGEVLDYLALIAASSGGFEGRELIIDALFGIGLSRPIDAYWREAFDRIHWHKDVAKAIAIDIPSGFNSDTGEVVDHPPEDLAKTVSYIDPQRIAFFDMTVTFHRMKRAHRVLNCARHCGKIVVVDIGLAND
ncbi:NAD(P)H-hydrate epimerase [Gemmobacter tilapiae]|uniref:NAD(P)H-hydrate epimerase n=1 Tax=Neogemmobacter tilapiae TaxID=875041 RepID=A0A918THN5_9RHOB|nr:NAD(P)H-hydrate epimerase [Gemmobacter tilapiae]GHC46493.1 NAD(P)H-hydrate epimerase [Gemmobacter tilapiae]